MIHPVLHVERDVPAWVNSTSRSLSPGRAALGRDGLVDEQQTPGVHHLRAALGHRLVQIGARHVACDQADDVVRGSSTTCPGLPHMSRTWSCRSFMSMVPAATPPGP